MYKVTCGQQVASRFSLCGQSLLGSEQLGVGALAVPKTVGRSNSGVLLFMIVSFSVTHVKDFASCILLGKM